MHGGEAKISCSIFQKQEPMIKEITDRLNKTKDYRHKIECASDLLRYIGILLTCSEYRPETLNCKNCRFIANLRKRTIDLIKKAKKLA